MSKEYLFTSESVSEGHPDKVADQISDSVLDAILAEDPKGRVACETLVSTGLVVISGEITTKAHINYREIAQETIKRIVRHLEVGTRKTMDWEDAIFQGYAVFRHLLERREAVLQVDMKKRKLTILK